jgi:hypothetical protein
MNSRDVARFKDVRDTKLGGLSKAHRAAGWMAAPYAVTAWDEFQGLTAAVGSAPLAVWSLITAFYPLHLRIGIGIGAVKTELANDAPLNQAATGEAFFRARAALDLVRHGRDPRYDPSSQADTGERTVDLFLNTTLHLLDALVARATPLQWEVILEYERVGRQDRVAAKLGKAESTVSRALKRAYYWQMIEAVTSMSEYLELRFPAPGDARAEDCP